MTLSRPEQTTWGYAALGRCGLGNMLFPWARCFLWCSDHGYPMIAPIWTQLRLGPYLRGERDKRQYQFFFHHDGYTTGLKRLLLLLTADRVDERAASRGLKTRKRNRIVVFRGAGELFKSLAGRHQQVREELMRIVKMHLIPAPSRKCRVGIHVRRGDFHRPSDLRSLGEGVTNTRIPIGWYVHALTELRTLLGYEAEAKVFSDAKDDDELQPLCQLPSVYRETGNSAITDLLSLASASIMIASGSTFSMWASYLGQVPCIWYARQRKQCVLDGPRPGILEPELGYNNSLPRSFRDALLTSSVASRLVEGNGSGVGSA